MRRTFSWRKTGTALSFLSFTYAVIGYCHAHKFAELPNSYLIIIGGVFAFYFGKNLFDGKKLVDK